MNSKIVIFIVQFLLLIKISTSVDISWSEADEVTCQIRDFGGSEPEVDKLIQLINKDEEKYTKVTTLQFVNSHFERLPKILSRKFQNVKKLYVEAVGLTLITRKDLKAFKKLEELHASYNKLTKFRADLFDFTPNVHSIYFMHNKINEIDVATIMHLKQLKVLDLRHNDCVDKKFKFSSKAEITKFSKEILIHCQSLDVPVNRPRRTIIAAYLLSKYLEEEREEKERKQRENREWTENYNRQLEEQRRQQEQQRQQQERQRQEQERKRKLEADKRNKIDEEQRRIQIATVDKDNRIRELERIINEQSKQFEIKRQELLIEYLKMLQNYIEKLQAQGTYDKTVIKAKIRITQIRLQKEMQLKYQSICKEIIDQVLESFGYTGKYFQLDWILSNCSNFQLFDCINTLLS